MYDIATLCERSHISPQTFYRLRNEHSDLEELVNNHREKRGKVYVYGEPVLEWLLNFYCIPQNEASASADDSTVSDPPERPSEPSISPNEVKDLHEKINDLEAEIEALKASLAEKERERKEIFLQNGQLLLLLAQEKQEKQLLLPAPRRPLLDRIRAAFSRDGHDK